MKSYVIEEVLLPPTHSENECRLIKFSRDKDGNRAKIADTQHFRRVGKEKGNEERERETITDYPPSPFSYLFPTGYEMEEGRSENGLAIHFMRARVSYSEETSSVKEDGKR